MTRRLIALVAVGAVLAGALVFLGARHLFLAGSFCPLRFDSEKVPRLSGFGGSTAAYAGPGPHSLASYQAESVTPVLFKMVAYKPSDEGLPASWDAKYENGKPADVQLLLCAYDKQYDEDADKVSQVRGQCDGYRYHDSNGVPGPERQIPVKAAPVTYLLYEAATKRLVTRFTLIAKDYTQSVCPYIASAEDPEVWITPRPADLAAALKPFVEASR
ncbi:hypothetical protein OG474_32620 [Kribbella sp. NBC_01505]|uniref:hypothetical protein n=1 Tax=Kribbella sp. NBC_01505 TaxID=2903580 RepID=UPI0038645DF8